MHTVYKDQNSANNKDTLFIVIPAYNESENIKQIVNDWYPIVEKYGNKKSKIVIIDDGSKDDTYAVLLYLAKTHKKLQPLTKKNSGHGATLLYGYNYAIKNGAQYIFQTDSDGQTLPSEFKEFWDNRKKYDIIIGHRKGRQDGFSRVIVTKVLKLTIRLFFKVNVTDANTPFRLMFAEPLKENLKLVPKNFNLSNVALSAIYVKKRQKVKFIPVTFRPRQGGINSINLKKIFGIGKNAVSGFKKINKAVEEELNRK